MEGSGNVASAIGASKMTLTPKKAGAKPLPTDEGKYIEVLKRGELIVAHRCMVVWYVLLLGLGGCGDRRARTAHESPTNPADSSYAIAPADTTWSDPAAHRAGYASSAGVRIH